MSFRRNHTVFSLALLLVLLVAGGCNPRRRMQDSDAFFRKYSLRMHTKPYGCEVPTDDLDALVRLRPNRKVAWIRFNLQMYNLVDTAKRSEQLKRKIDRLERRDSVRISRNKAPKHKEARTFRTWLSYTVGEPPAVFDSLRMERTANQMEILLHKSGYFSAHVDPEVVYKYSSKGLALFIPREKRIYVSKARLKYHIYPEEPYRIRSIRYETTDTLLRSRMEFFDENSVLDTGQVFDVTRLDQERESITSYLNNRGYYDFTKDYIVFDYDSTVGGRKVDVKLILNAPRRTDRENPDSIEFLTHEKFFIGTIEVHTSYSSFDPNYAPTDTTLFGGFKIVSNGRPVVRPELIACTIGFNEGDQYERDRVEQTYKRFSSLQIFSQVGIKLIPRNEVLAGGGRIIDCQILLTPAPRQSLSINPRFTHSGSNLGLAGDLSYRHKNMLRGAESLGMSVVASFEAQQLITEAIGQGGQIGSNRFNPNTFEIGPELSVSVPRLVPFGCDFTRRSSQPVTTFNAQFNFQTRPDYTRTLSQLRSSWRWTENAARGSELKIDFPEFSIIKIDKSAAFENYLTDVGDQYLINSYSDHLILATGLGWTQNNQRAGFQRFHSYQHLHAEYAGFARHFQEVLGSPRNESGNYELFGIRYAEYVMLDADYRQYVNLDNTSSLAMRASGGIGKPLQNLNVLPFEKSFFSGGTNGIRAWRSRSLGPGSFRDTTQLGVTNAIGELKLELNFEYRFKLTSMFGMAFFMDAGNVWLLKPDVLRPGSDFNRQRFLSEIAVGTGLGARLDFDFFLIRFDFGLQLKDPAKIPGERWIWEPKDEYSQFLTRFNTDTKTYRYSPQVIFNLGIGYPF